MSILKKIFAFRQDNDTVIGLCKFNNDLKDYETLRKNAKKRFNKNATLTQLLKRTV